MIERQRQSCLNEYPEGTQYSRWWGVGPLNVLGSFSTLDDALAFCDTGPFGGIELPSYFQHLGGLDQGGSSRPQLCRRHLD